ncbi:MAG: hypothetical protein HYR88_18990 [Verrucomicrobia bacterium]|nr:hypothetical protein [Verrucomicrobiota bacterium]MBI3868340.1 hypothetical protein [Verrucomicrobiota bacterium]
MIFLMDEVGHFLEFLGSNSGNLFLPPDQLLRKPLVDVMPMTEAAAWSEAIRVALATQETQVIKVKGLLGAAADLMIEARIASCGADRILASLLPLLHDFLPPHRPPDAPRPVSPTPPPTSLGGTMNTSASARC